MILTTHTLASLLDEKNDLLQQTVNAVIHPNGEKPCIHPDFPDISFEPSKNCLNRKMLLSKLDLAVSGILFAEKYYHALHPISRRIPTQHDYLQLPVLISETHPHGIAAPEILDCWYHWFPEGTPEYTAAEAIRDGCPILKIGRYQTVPDDHLITIERTLAWSLLYAGEPKLAAERAFQDASLTANSSVAEAASFVAAAVSFSFLRTPKDAITASLYGMPFSFIDEVMEYHIKPMQPRSKPSEHCALLFSVLQNTDSLQDCLEQLKQYHAEAFCYLAAGAMFGANSSAAPEKQDVDLSGLLKFCPAVSKQDLVERYADLHPWCSEIKLPWE